MSASLDARNFFGPDLANIRIGEEPQEESVSSDWALPLAGGALSAKQIAQIANSIREFGFNHPVLVDRDSVIIAGHGRVATELSQRVT